MTFISLHMEITCKNKFYQLPRVGNIYVHMFLKIKEASGLM